jgi:hypothetical protein
MVTPEINNILKMLKSNNIKFYIISDIEEFSVNYTIRDLLEILVECKIEYPMFYEYTIPVCEKNNNYTLKDGFLLDFSDVKTTLYYDETNDKFMTENEMQKYINDTFDVFNISFDELSSNFNIYNMTIKILNNKFKIIKEHAEIHKYLEKIKIK